MAQTLSKTLGDELDNDLHVPMNQSQTESEIAGQVDADTKGEAVIKADSDTVVIGNAEADAEVEADVKTESEAHSEVDQSEANGRTQIHVNDNRDNKVTIDMPHNKGKKIQYNSPVLTVEDDPKVGQSAAPQTPPAPQAPPAP